MGMETRRKKQVSNNYNPRAHAGSSHMESKNSTAKANSRSSNELELEQTVSLANYSVDKSDDHLTLYFVLANDLAAATCSSRLSMAFQLCKENDLKAEWIKEEACLRHMPRKGNVFVMDPFEGPVYDYLSNYYKTNEFLILGPQCIRQIFQRQEANMSLRHRGHPMFTLGMQNVIVTFTGFRDDVKKKKHILNLINKMGGFYCATYTKAVTHVVAESILSAKSLTAYSSGIPVMTSDWVEAVWKESLNDISIATDLHFAKYACPIFHKLNICFSQIPVSKKSALRKIIEGNGGTYTAELQKGKTHVLIVEQGQGEKFRYAKQWNLPCVLPQWIDDSKRARHILPTEKYIVHLETECLTSTQIDSKRNARRDFSVSALHDGSLDVCNVSHFTNQNSSTVNTKGQESNIHLEAILQSLEENQILDGFRIYLGGTRTGMSEQLRKLLNKCGATRLDRLSEHVSHVVVIGSALLEQELQALKNLNARPYIVSVDWLITSAKKGSAAEEEEFSIETATKNNSSKGANTFRGRNSGDLKKSSDEHKHLRSKESLSSSASKNSAENHENVIGEVFETEEGDEVMKDLDLEQYCVPHVDEPNTGQHVGEGFDLDDDQADDIFEQAMDLEKIVDAEEVVRNISENNGDTKVEGPEEEPGLIERKSCEADEIQAVSKPDISSDKENQDQDETSWTAYPSSQNLTKTFADNRFSILLKNSEETAEIKQYIQNMGGVIAQSPDIIILPPVYTIDRTKASLQLYTKFWVYDCHEAKSPNIQVEFYHIPLKAFNGMTKIMTDVVIAVSAYSAYQKKYIEAVATAMGARFQDVFARKTSQGVFQSTHLICNVVDNQKFNAAVKWNVPVVRHEWLMACFHEQKKLDIEPFRVEKTETRGSILPETPKAKVRQDKAASIYGATDKQPEKFKIPQIIPKKTPDLHRGVRGKSSCEGNVTPVIPSQPSGGKMLRSENVPEQSPYFTNLSRMASRQLKMALDSAASDSPSPDYSSIRFKLPKRNSTPDSSGFTQLWRAVREKFKGQAQPVENAIGSLNSSKTDHNPLHIARLPPSKQASQILTNEMLDNNLSSQKDQPNPIKKLKRPSDPEESLEVDKADNQCNEEVNNCSKRGSKKQKTDSIHAIMLEEFGNFETPPQEDADRLKNQINTLDYELIAKDETVSKLTTGRRRQVNQDPTPSSLDTVSVNEQGQSQHNKVNVENPANNYQDSVYWKEGKEISVKTDAKVSSDEGVSSKSSSCSPHSSAMATEPSTTSTLTTVVDRAEAKKDGKIDTQPTKLTFLFSGALDDNEIDKYNKIITELGGETSKSGKYHAGIDALAVKKISRSEKVLGAIAAGKPIVPCEYLLNSKKAGKFLDLTEFMLKPNAKSYSTLDNSIITAANRWFDRVQEDPCNRPFSKYCVIIVEPDKARESSYKNLIEAGGGIVWTASCHRDPNLIIGIEETVKPRLKLKTLPNGSEKLVVKPPLFLNEMILKK